MRQSVHDNRVVYCENGEVVAQLKAIAARKGMTFSELQRAANRMLLEAA